MISSFSLLAHQHNTQSRSPRAHTRGIAIFWYFLRNFLVYKNKIKKKTIEKLVWTERWRLSILSIKSSRVSNSLLTSSRCFSAESILWCCLADSFYLLIILKCNYQKYCDVSVCCVVDSWESEDSPAFQSSLMMHVTRTVWCKQNSWRR